MEPINEKTLCFVTWNVCGKKNISSRIDALSEKLGAEILFLQETKIGPEDTIYDDLDDWQCFYTVYDSSSKGVAILINKCVKFQYICHEEDYTGGYIVLFCFLNGELFTLVNVYQHKNDKDVLNNLRDYLRETAEGVLVVGGDFNIVQDLSFDQKSKAKDLDHRQSWEMFKKLTASLNLIDTWAYFCPTGKKFTYTQNESSSRLDLFLLCEEDLGRIKDVDIYEGEVVEDGTSTRKTSDHSPLWIHLKMKEQSSHEIPEVALWLKHIESQAGPDKREGKINGAEILSAIKSLTDSRHKRPDGMSVQRYKKSSCPYTEILKVRFNNLMTCRKLPEDFNSFIIASDGTKHFNVEYLIFSMILGKRLKTLLNSYSEKSRQLNKTDNCFVSFAVKPCKIKWSFLAHSLSFLLKDVLEKKKNLLSEIVIPLKGLVDEDVESTKKDSVLRLILPKPSQPSDDFRELQNGCPLTRSILSLVLKYLEVHINMKSYTTHICHIRQVVVIREDYEKACGDLDSLMKKFKKDSGIELKIEKI